MTHGVRPALMIAMLAGLAAVASGCRSLPAGPSVSNVTVGPLTLQSTTGDPAVCCCRVIGTTRNDNTVPVHATFKFAAYDGVTASPISRILFFVGDFRPGDERPIDAHWFVYPCAIIRELRTELDVRAITLPPL